MNANRGEKRAWLPVALVLGGVAAGAGCMYLCINHGAPSKAAGATAGGASAMVLGAMPAESAAAPAAPPSVEMDGTRIPPPVQIIEPAQPAPNTTMQFTPTPATQFAPAGASTGSAGYDARTVVVDGRQLEFSQTASGYPINVGRRAVDSNDPEQAASNPIGSGVTQDPGGWRTDNVTNAQYIGSKGLIENPNVDPPSTHGRSYSRAY